MKYLFSIVFLVLTQFAIAQKDSPWQSDQKENQTSANTDKTADYEWSALNNPVTSSSTPTPPVTVPIDRGLFLLIIVGGGLGLKILREKHNQE